MMETVLFSVKIKIKCWKIKKNTRALGGNSYNNVEERLFLHYKYSSTVSPSFTLGVQLESRHDKDANANDYKLSRLHVIDWEKEDTRGMKETV